MNDRQCVATATGTRTADRTAATGMGTLCAEAQADGVPCETLGVDCETCERANVVDVRMAQRGDRVAFAPPVHRA